MRAHDHAGPTDVRRMQELTQRLWTPSSQWHIGDLAWGRYQHTGREQEWPTRLWINEQENISAWGWIELPDYLSFLVDPAEPGVADDVIAWFEEVAGPGERSANVTEGVELSALARHGYQRQPGAAHFVHQARDLEGLPEPTLPEGFRLRCAPELERRVAVHAAAWAPTRVTTDSYRTVIAAWPYRPELDWVVEAPDGRYAASALIWLDEENRAGLIEPVGADPGFRRLGLSRAVCLAALHALKATGATHAYVNPRGDEAYPIPARLYRSMGFTDGPRTYAMVKSA